MKSSMLVAVLLGLLVVVASAHERHGKGGPHAGGHHGGHHKGPATEKPAFCSYKSTKGHTFDFSHLASKDLLVKDMLGGSTYHFNPCGSVHAKECPAGSAVCEITSKGAAISHGLASNAHWADGVESGASVEVMYGGGELCAEGEHRKTAVEMRCLPSSKEGASFLMGIIKEDCLLKLIVESPLACDMEAVCSAIKTEDACNDNSDLCDWKHGLCMAAENKHGMFGSRKQIVAFVISAFIGFTVVVSLCCVATCVCIACRRVVRKRQLRRSLPTYKKAKRTSKKAGKKVAAEELNLITPETFENVIPENSHYPFQAYAMQQAADGSFVPVPVHMPMPPHAYSYPMVMQATYHVQQQPTQQ